MSDCKKGFLQNCPNTDFRRHLAGFPAFGKGLAERIGRAPALRKCRLCPASPALRPMAEVIARRPDQCWADVTAFFRAGFFAAGVGAAARPSTASRPAPRISSENSPFPAIRANTSVPIMVASVATARLRAVLRGTPAI